MESDSECESASESDSTEKTETIRKYSFKCEVPGCKSIFDRPFRLREHMNTHNNERPYKCTHKRCNMAFASKGHLRRHLQRIHDAAAKANDSSKVGSDSDFESASESDSAEKTETTREKKYSCEVPGCKAIFHRPSKLKFHMNTHNDERPFKCTHEGCDKSYTNSSHLKRHSQTHSTAATMYKCTICSVSISTLSNLKRHYNRVHKPNRELFCKECNVSFRKKSRYEEHITAHEHSLKFTCEKCGKIFIGHEQLQRHLFHHKSKASKTYTCPLDACSQVFEKWRDFVNHKKTEKHGGDIVCSKCDKKFQTKAELKIHSTTDHETSRPAIPCPYENCNRLYYYKKNLKQHINTKHIGKKFLCDICGLKLATKQKIELHIINIHLSEKRPFKRKAQGPRKDIGLAKRSVLTKLTGIQLSMNTEIQLMKRNPAALLRDKAIAENSLSEDDRASDVSVKGA